MSYSPKQQPTPGFARLCTTILCAAFCMFVVTVLGAFAEAEAASLPADCGREGQRPCKVWEHVPSCATGLEERPLGKRCSKKQKATPLIQRPANCGGLNERPCPLPHIPSCDQGLVENFAANRCQSTQRPSHCGREGQKPCTLAEFFPSCDGRLVEDFIANRCIKSEGDIINIARNTAEEVGSFAQAAASTMQNCGVFALMEAVDKNRPSTTAGAIAAKGCFQTLLAEADRLGYQTVTIGGSGGGGLLIGADGENGFAFDVKGRYAPSTYHNLGFKIGLTAGGGAALTVGFYKGTNQPGPDGFGGDGHGAAVGAAVYGGSGIAVWYGYDGSFSGFNAVVTAGGELDVVYVRNTTEIISLGTVPANSGVGWQNQQPAPIQSSAPPPYRPAPSAQTPPPATYDDPNLAAAAAIGQGLATIMETRAQQSRVKVCNKTDVDDVNFAIIQSLPSANGYGYEWMATGWYQAKRKRCETVRLPTNADGSAYVGQAYFVFYGQRNGTDTFWGDEGNPAFCVDLNSRFTFRGADQMACNGQSLAQIGAFPRVISLGTNQIDVTD